ncbi:hypothetical protein Bbelb_227170 [Branchiostoma belcheri]|nr:hypothetical protein Bbelb_227170 [Branchiostoma belcheri]
MTSNKYIGIIFFGASLLTYVYASGCPYAYVYHQPSRLCYKAFDDTATYNGSVSRCSLDGGTLAMPRDTATNEFLVGLKNAVDNSTYFRFGLTDPHQEGVWMWDDNIPLGDFRAWGPGEPNNLHEDCAEYWAGSQIWNDAPCTWADRKFICQVSPFGRRARFQLARSSPVARPCADESRPIFGRTSHESRPYFVFENRATVAEYCRPSRELREMFGRPSFVPRPTCAKFLNSCVLRASFVPVSDEEYQCLNNVLTRGYLSAEFRPTAKTCVLSTASKVQHPEAFGPSSSFPDIIYYQLIIDECNTTIYAHGHGCSHGCTDLEDGYICTCPQGWEMSPTDNRNCTDIDECATNNDDCSDGCENNDGSYNCTCPPGRTLFTDGLNCQIHGNWSEWSPWSGCSADCGIGRQTGRRSCTNPAPQYGGRGCGQRGTRSKWCYEDSGCTGESEESDNLTIHTIAWAESESLKSGESVVPGYDISTRPIQEEETLHIVTSVYIRQVGRLNEEHANMSVTVEYTLSWYDPRLQGIATTWVPVPRSMIWLPPLMFGTSVRRAAPVHDDTPAWVNYDGLTVCKITRKLHVSCPVVLKKYPFDNQTCSIKLHAYNGLRLHLMASDDVRYAAAKTDATGVVSQFELTGADVQASLNPHLNSTACVFFQQKCEYSLDECLFRRFPDCHLSDECQQCTSTVGQCGFELNRCQQGQSSYTTLEVRLRMTRRLSSYAFRLFLPSAAVVVAAYLQLWLPLQTSVIAGRITLGITGFLTVIVKGSGTGAVSWVNETRAIDIWFSGCQIVVILMFLETIIVYFVRCRLEEKHQKKKAEQEKNLEASDKPERSRERTPTGTGQGRQRTPSRIPRATLTNPQTTMWHKLPDGRWVVIPRPPGGELSNAMLMTSIKARWREGPDGQYRMVSTDEPVIGQPINIPRPKLRVRPTVAWERKMDGGWRVVHYPGDDKIHVGWEPIRTHPGWKSLYFTKEELKMIVVPGLYAGQPKPTKSNKILRRYSYPGGPVIYMYVKLNPEPPRATTDEDAKEEEKIQRVTDRIDNVARTVFPVMYTIFCIGFLLYYLEL